MFRSVSTQVLICARLWGGALGCGGGALGCGGHSAVGGTQLWGALGCGGGGGHSAVVGVWQTPATSPLGPSTTVGLVVNCHGHPNYTKFNGPLLFGCHGHHNGTKLNGLSATFVCWWLIGHLSHLLYMYMYTRLLHICIFLSH